MATIGGPTHERATPTGLERKILRGLLYAALGLCVLSGGASATGEASNAALLGALICLGSLACSAPTGPR